MIHRIKTRLSKVVSMMIILTIFAIGYYFREHDRPEKVVFIPKAVGEEFVFWKTMCMGVELAAKEEGLYLEIVGSYNEHSIDEQRKEIEKILKEKPDLMLIAPIDDTVEPLIQDAMSKGIKVVGVDSAVESFEQLVATDNKEGMRNLTQYMVSMIGEEEQIGMINFSKGSRTARLREEGYQKALEETGHRNVIPTVYADGGFDEAYRIAVEILTTEPGIKGLIGANQYMTEGIYMAVRDLGLVGKVKVMGFDSSDIIIEGIEKGAIEAILVQKPFNMGYLSVKAGLTQFRGQRFEEKIDIDYKLITRDVLYEAENQKLLYPIIE